MPSPIAGLLLATAPHSDDVALFGQFVGAWAMDGTDIAADGSETHYRGRSDFGYVLEGRAIQESCTARASSTAPRSAFRSAMGRGTSCGSRPSTDP